MDWKFKEVEEVSVTEKAEAKEYDDILADFLKSGIKSAIVQTENPTKRGSTIVCGLRKARERKKLKGIGIILKKDEDVYLVNYNMGRGE